VARCGPYEEYQHHQPVCSHGRLFASKFIGAYRLPGDRDILGPLLKQFSRQCVPRDLATGSDRLRGSSI
jgi:hypothetical protein